MTEIRFPIEATHIMMFARSVGDPNRVYEDAEYAATTEVGGIIAPPTFVQARAQFDPDYSGRPKIGEAWLGSGREPTGVKVDDSSEGGDSLHAEQHYTYHQPLRPGEVLRGTARVGKTWEKQGRRAGKLIFTEKVTEWRNRGGELMVTASTVSVQTERTVETSEADDDA